MNENEAVAAVIQGTQAEREAQMKEHFHQNRTSIRYERKGDGSFVSVEERNGSPDIERPVVIPDGGSMLKDGSGNWVLCSDMAEYHKSRELDSHIDFMDRQLEERVAVDTEYSEESKAAIDFEQACEDRRKLRALENYRKLAFETFVLRDRVDPTLKEIKITDEKFLELKEEYHKVRATFTCNGDAVAYLEEGGFQPLSAYVHKVKRFRPLVKGEVGMMGSQIVVLQEGYGTGNRVSVKDAVK